MGHIIQLCAEEAFRQGYDMVGMQYYGECWSGKNAEKDYNKHRRSKNCEKGVGKKSTNYVYRIRGKKQFALFVRNTPVQISRKVPAKCKYMLNLSKLTQLHWLIRRILN